ncbi:MAG TPA: site-2 protease family protein, partial [Micromonosporaceae bacterium]|nr:site-2 protease family protein [Micromonosporaceae bacterium]
MTTTSWAQSANQDGGLRLFRFAGVPVLLAPSWWLGSAVVVVFYTPLVFRFLPGIDLPAAFLLAMMFAVLLGASVLAHELGHCVAALRLGLPVRRVRLFLLGGLSEIARTPRRPRHEFVVAVAGPAVSVLLAALCWLVLLVVPDEGAVRLLVLECVFAIAAVAVFYLLP